MSATLQVITWPITIDATNDHIDINEGGGELNAEIPQATYEDIWSDSTVAGSLAKAIADELNDTGALTYTVTVSDTGVYTIAASGTFSLLFNTGSNVANSARYVLGFGAVDGVTAATYTASKQCYNAFVFGETGPDLSSDSEWMDEHNLPTMTAMSGAVSQYPLGGTRERRLIRIGFMDRDHAWNTQATNTAISLQDLFDYIVGSSGRYFRFYDDRSDPTTYDQAHWDPEGIVAMFNPQRIDESVELWDMEMTLLKKV